MAPAIAIFVLLLAPGLQVAARGAGPSRSADDRSLLLRHIDSGQADSAAILIRSNRVQAERTVEMLLLRRLRALVDGDADSAAWDAERAETIARLYASEHGDSFCIRRVASYERFSREAAGKTHRGWKRYDEARRLYGLSDWQEAQRVLQEVMGLAGEVPDPYLEESARTYLASCRFMQGAPDEARQEYRAALALARRIGDRAGEARLLRNIAMSYQAQGRAQESIRTLRRVLATAGEIGYTRLYADALNDLGFYHFHKGDLDSARILFDRVLSMAEREGFRRLAGNALMNLGLVHWQLGAHDRALHYEELALRTAREESHRRQEMGVLLNMASIHTDMEQYSRAVALLREALSIAQEVGAADIAAQSRDELGTAYRLLGRPEEALRIYEEALVDLRSAGKMSSIATALGNIGAARTELGDLAGALASFEEAVRVAQRTQSPLSLATALANLGRMHRVRGELLEAQAVLERARSVAGDAGSPMMIGLIEHELGRTLLARGDRSAAQSLFDRAVARGRRARSPYLLWRALASQAASVAEQGDLARADTLLAEAMEIVESIRGKLSGEEFRIGFMEDKKDVYTRRVDVLYRLGQVTDVPGEAHLEAFRVAERAKSRALLDVLAGAHPGPRADVDPVLERRAARLRMRLAQVQSELSRAASRENWDAALVDSLEQTLRQAKRAYRSAVEEIAARSPAFGSLYGEGRILGVPEIRDRILAPDQLLLEFLVGDRETYLFLVSRTRFEMRRIPAGADSLGTLVAALRTELAAQEAPGASARERLRGHLRRLYDLLLQPYIETTSEGIRLLIVPDGALFYLPFAALHDGSRFLVERHPVSYAPSASVCDPSIHPVPQDRSRNLLAFGNPTSFRTEELLGSAQRALRDWRFGPLPYAQDEVERVARCFSRSRILVRSEATEEAVKAGIGRATHVHFATHGFLEESEPAMSALVLAQDDDPAEDGLLQVHEIVDLELSADLVTLSACNTGLGRLAGGEGVLGLTRAFLYAGARSLLISLWEVPDRTTAQLMETFYQWAMREGLAGDLALRRAQLSLMATGVSVREWAPFCLVGSTDVSGARPGPSRRIIAFGAAALALMLVALRIRARHRRGRPARTRA